MASQSSATSSGPFTAMVSTCPFGSSGHRPRCSKAHLPTSAPFRVRPLGPASGRSPRRPPGAAATLSRVPSPFGHRHPLLGHPVPPRNSAPLTIGLPEPRKALDPTGFPRSTHTRYGRSGRPLYPEASGVLTTGSHSPVAACRPCQRPGPITQVFVPSSRVRNNEASSGVHSRSPARPSPRPVAPPDGTGALRLLPWASHPNGQDPSTHAGRGSILNTDPELRTRHDRPPICELTRYARPRVAREKSLSGE
jgi:hypothetical protein